jgi:hypothetical protein
MLIVAAALLQAASALPPTPCDGPRYLCEAGARALRACRRPPGSDARPFTLCLAETENGAVERELRRRLAIAARGGHAGLRAAQARWERARARTCAAEADEAPGPEQARAQLTCLTRAAIARIAALSRPRRGAPIQHSRPSGGG